MKEKCMHNKTTKTTFKKSTERENIKMKCNKSETVEYITMLIF